MKLKYPIAALAAGFVLAGCAQTKQAQQLRHEGLSLEEQVIYIISTADKQRDVQAAVATLKDYMAEQRTVFVATVQARLTDMDRKITELGDTITSLNTDAEAQATVDSLHDLRSDLDPLLNDLNKMDLNSWYETRQAFEASMAELQKAYESARTVYAPELAELGPTI